MLICLGLSGEATTTETVLTCALRLVRGTLDLLRNNSATSAGRVEPNLPDYLIGGELMNWLAQNP